MELTIITNNPVFMNRDLEKATNALINCDLQIRSRQYSIAAILAEIDAKKLYEDDGFTSVPDYAFKVFGMKKSTCYDLIEIGKTYVRPIYTKSGKISAHCSNLLPPADAEKQDAPILDFTTRQIATFKTLGRDKVVDLIAEGKLNPSMTNAAIVELVKAEKLLTEPEPENVEEQTQEQSEPEQEQTSKLSKFSDEELIWEISKRGYTVFLGNHAIEPKNIEEGE